MALSQAEIDALLAKLATEGEQQAAPQDPEWRVVKTYDFRRPDKLSKDQMRTLQLLHESLGRIAGSTVSAYLRTAVQMNLVSIDQGVYGEYVDHVPQDSILHILSLDPLPSNVLISLDSTAAMAAVDRLLGGAGTATKSAQIPTEIELALIRTLVSCVLRAMKEAWSRVEDLSPTVQDIVLDPRFVQIALKSDPVVVVAFEMSILHHSGTLTLCLPYVVLEPVLPKLSAQHWFASAKRGAAAQTDTLRRHLDSVRVNVAVELGGASVSLRDLGQLKVGDVLIINRAVDDDLELLVGGRPLFAARPGTVGHKLAVQVVGAAPDQARTR